MFTCDVCLKEFDTNNSLLVHSSVVLACEAYLDHLVHYWTEKGIVPEKTFAGQSQKAIRGMAHESIRQDAGSSPWLVCEDCAGRFFGNCLTAEAREQALAYMQGQERPGFDGKSGTPIEGFEKEPEAAGPRLLNEAPDRSVDFRDKEKPSGPDIYTELEKLAVAAEKTKKIVEVAPAKDDHPSAADILKSLGEGKLPPRSDSKDEFSGMEPVPGAATDDDLADLGLPDEDLKLDDELEEVPAGKPMPERTPVPKSKPAPRPIGVPSGHMSIACVCGKQMVVPQSYSGRRFRCKTCGATVVIGGIERKDKAGEILPLAVEAVGKGNINSALRHLIGALEVAPDNEEVRDFAAMTLYQATRKPGELDEKLLNDRRFDRFFSECRSCQKTWVPNPIAPTGEPTKDGGICVTCGHAYCPRCSDEGGEVCRDCGAALVAVESATGRTSKAPVETANLKKILLLHEAVKFTQPDLNRILAEFRPELKVRGIRFALFPTSNWPQEIAQVVAVLAHKHAKDSDFSRLRHEVLTDPGTKKRLCLVYCYA